MATDDPRIVLARLAEEQGTSLSALSRMLGRNVAYLQQFVRRGTPRRLEEEDGRRLAAFFGVDPAVFGSDPAGGRTPQWRLPRLDIAASAGPGTLVDGELLLGSDLIDPDLARRLGLQQGQAAMLRVRGDSMAPGLMEGDQILLDLARTRPDSRGGVFVIRIDDVLMVKRVRKAGRSLAITSDNPAAPPVPDGPATVIGRVVWQMRALI